MTMTMTMTRRARLAAAVLLAALAVLPAVAQAGPGSRPGSEIVGGTPVGSKAEFPFMAAVDNVNTEEPYWCGGSVIAPRYVVTAAHCAYDFDLLQVVTPGERRVAVGYLDLGKAPERAWIPVRRVMVHPKFDPVRSGLSYDVAVLELAAPVTGVTPARLPAAGDQTGERRGDEMTVIGWGRKYAFGPASARLRQATVQVEAGWQCKQDFGGGGDFSIALSACFYTPGKSACNGDSGSPVLAREGDRWVQRGIVSGGYICAGLNIPWFGTRLSNPEINRFVRETAGLKGS
ncbi:MAG: S1 family peptidase [Chloroflexota bacterium]